MKEPFDHFYQKGNNHIILSLDELHRTDSRLTALENRTTILETGLGQLQIKIDTIREDVALIKTAVIQ